MVIENLVLQMCDHASMLCQVSRGLAALSLRARRLPFLSHHVWFCYIQLIFLVTLLNTPNLGGFELGTHLCDPGNIATVCIRG